MTALEMHTRLMALRNLERSLWQLKIQRDELQSCLLPKAIRYDKDIVQSSPEDAMADIAGRVLDIEAKMADMRRQKAHMIVDLSRQIAGLDNDDEQIILMAYYIGRMSGYQIAENIVHLSPRRVYQLRWAGLEHLAEKISHIAHPVCDIV